MTGCLLACVPVDPDRPDALTIPVLVTDTLATLKIPPPSAARKLPATSTPEHASKRSSVRITRKLRIIGSGAFAFAGDGEQIDLCVRELRMQFRDLARELSVSDKVLEWSQKLGIECVGSSAATNLNDPPTSRAYFAFGSSASVTFRHFGKCFAIGSGAERLLEVCRLADAHIETNWRGQRSAQLKLEMLVNRINSEKLCSELIGDPKGHPTYGGYIEWAQLVGYKWRRGPNHATFFYEVRYENGTATVAPLHRTILYHPGPSVGCVLSISKQGATTFKLHDDTEDVTETPTITSLFGNWQASSGTIVVVDEIEPGNWRYTDRPILPSELRHIHFHFDELRGVSAGLKQEYLLQVFAEYAKRRGMRFEVR